MLPTFIKGVSIVDTQGGELGPTMFNSRSPHVPLCFVLINQNVSLSPFCTSKTLFIVVKFHG